MFPLHVGKIYTLCAIISLLKVTRMKNRIKLGELVLPCYAEQESDGSWFAICLELNLYARGDNFQEARSKLNRLIRAYLQEAVSKHADYISDLIPRRAPFYFWARYYLIKALSSIHRLASKQEFKLPLPVVPAV